MERCPTCSLMLETTTVEGQAVHGCRECGGLLFAAADLTALAKSHPRAFGELERRYNATLLAASRAGAVPECGRCGESMKERSFPKAPDVPMYTCGKCKLVWLRDGQAEALQAAVAPDSVKTRWAQAAEEEHLARVAAAEEDDDEDAEAIEAHGYGPLGLWPERLDLQPWASWIVCGMPLWLAPLLVGGVGLLGMALAQSNAFTAQLAGIHLLAPFIMWPIQSLFLAMALHLTWIFTYDSPGNTIGETFALLLRVVPVVMLVETLGSLIALATGSWFIGRLTQFILGLMVYRRVMELEWRDIIILAVVSRILAAFIGLGAILTILDVAGAAG